MKVGLFVGDIRPSDGGGFTYVSALLNEIVMCGQDVRHEFVVLSTDPTGTERLASLPTVYTLREKHSVLTGNERFFSHFPGVVERTWNRARKAPTVFSWDARVYQRCGIDFLLRLVPWSATTMDLPFGAVVWDLQHRNNPWFPEVSQLGEWDGRERNFAALCRRASIIFTGTATGAEEIERYYQIPPARIRVLPFPTPSFAIRARELPADAEAIRKLDIPADYLLYPAQFWAHKNHVTVLEACRRVREQTGWDLGVVFVGSDKGNLEYVRQYAQKLGLEESTRILGYVGQDGLAQLYKNAFCLAFATFCGPDNLPPLEAMALGCPVIASAVPGAEEQLGDAGLLFAPGDDRELADLIVRLRSDPSLRRRLTEAGSQRAARHTWSDYLRGIEEALDEFARIRRAWPA